MCEIPRAIILSNHKRIYGICNAQYFVFKILNKMIIRLWQVSQNLVRFVKYFSRSRCDKFLYSACSFSILFLRFRISLHSSSIHPSSILFYQFIRVILVDVWIANSRSHSRSYGTTYLALSCREMHYCYRHNPRRFNGTSINTHVRCYVTFFVATRFVDWDFLGWLSCCVHSQVL